MSAQVTPVQAKHFNEILVVTDDQTWIWALVSTHLAALGMDHVRLPSTIPVRQSWERLKHAQRIVIHWECKLRSGGAVIEEILDVQPDFDVAERVIVVTTNPTHEDVVYFSELGIRRIIRLRNREKDLHTAGRELDMHLAADTEKDPVEQAWRKIIHVLDTLPDEVPAETIVRLEEGVRRLKPAEYTASTPSPRSPPSATTTRPPSRGGTPPSTGTRTTTAPTTT
jgi:hypothetical protein